MDQRRQCDCEQRPCRALAAWPHPLRPLGSLAAASRRCGGLRRGPSLARAMSRAEGTAGKPSLRFEAWDGTDAIQRRAFLLAIAASGLVSAHIVSLDSRDALTTGHHDATLHSPPHTHGRSVRWSGCTD